MLAVSEVVDDRRPIRRELNRPDDLTNMHNKWTFPTSLLYVLTVLTTCGEQFSLLLLRKHIFPEDQKISLVCENQFFSNMKFSAELLI